MRPVLISEYTTILIDHLNTVSFKSVHTRGWSQMFWLWFIDATTSFVFVRYLVRKSCQKVSTISLQIIQLRSISVFSWDRLLFTGSGKRLGARHRNQIVTFYSFTNWRFANLVRNVFNPYFVVFGQIISGTNVVQSKRRSCPSPSSNSRICLDF